MMLDMPFLGLALATVMSFANPDDVTEAPIVVVTPPPAPAPAVVVVPAPAGAPLIVPPPPPPPIPRKPMSGAGLMAAGASAFLIGLSAQITMATSQAAYCSNWWQKDFNTVHGCFYWTEPWQTHAGTGLAFGSSLVMTSIGAGALGQQHAWSTTYAGAPDRNPRSRVITGAVLASLGVGAFIAEGFLVRQELNNFCTTFECEVQRRALYYTVADLGAASLIAGVATMSYGNNYRHNRRRYGQHWTIAPQAAPGMLGASGSLRF
jgi:hypothetical protein